MHLPIPKELVEAVEQMGETAQDVKAIRHLLEQLVELTEAQALIGLHVPVQKKQDDRGAK